MRSIQLLMLAGSCLMLTAHPVLADNAPEPGATPPVADEPSVVDIVIGEIEGRIIRDYYQRHYDDWERDQGGSKHKNKKKGNDKGLPPGLAKRGELPPGLAKQLQRNGHLPPGLEKRDLPPDLLTQLPALDPAYRYVIADNKVMLIRRATNLILDTLTVAAIDLLN